MKTILVLPLLLGANLAFTQVNDTVLTRHQLGVNFISLVDFLPDFSMDFQEYTVQYKYALDKINLRANINYFNNSEIEEFTAYTMYDTDTTTLNTYQLTEHVKSKATIHQAFYIGVGAEMKWNHGPFLITAGLDINIGRYISTYQQIDLIDINHYDGQLQPAYIFYETKELNNKTTHNALGVTPVLGMEYGLTERISLGGQLGTNLMMTKSVFNKVISYENDQIIYTSESEVKERVYPESLQASLGQNYLDLYLNYRF